MKKKVIKLGESKFQLEPPYTQPLWPYSHFNLQIAPVHGVRCPIKLVKDFVDKIVDGIKPPTKEREIYKHIIMLVVLTLVRCIHQGGNLAIPLDDDRWSEYRYLDSLGVLREPCEQILSFLIKEGYLFPAHWASYAFHPFLGCFQELERGFDLYCPTGKFLIENEKAIKWAYRNRKNQYPNEPIPRPDFMPKKSWIPLKSIDELF